MGEVKDWVLMRAKKRLDLKFEVRLRTERGRIYAIPISFYSALKERGDNPPLFEEIRNPNDKVIRQEGFHMPVLEFFKEENDE